jgi:hypothetical protein
LSLPKKKKSLVTDFVRGGMTKIIKAKIKRKKMKVGGNLEGSWLKKVYYYDDETLSY